MDWRLRNADVTSATASRTESFVVVSSGEWSIDAGVGGGLDAKVTAPVAGISVNTAWSLTVGA